MSTPYSGDPNNQGGIFMKPALGSHVIINYFNENMETPYVQGSLYYEKKSAPGYKWEYSGIQPVAILPGMDNRFAYTPSSNVHVIESGAGHSITFVDGAKTSFAFNHFLPMFNVLAAQNPEVPNLNNGGIILSDQSGIYRIAMNSIARTINIESPVGKVNISAFTGINITAPNGDVNIVGKNVNIRAGNNLNLRAGTNISPIKKPNFDFKKTLFGMVETAFFTDVELFASSVRIPKVGNNPTRFVDLSFLRSCVETILRPVEGTLNISSPRNITITAGKGKTIIPSYLLTQETASFMGKLKTLTGQQMYLATKDNMPFVRINKLLQLAREGIYEYYNRKLVQYKEIITHVDKIYSLLSNNQNDNAYMQALGLLNGTTAAAIRGRFLDGQNLKDKHAIVQTMVDNQQALKGKVTSTNPNLVKNARELKDEYNAAFKAYKKLFSEQDDDDNAKITNLINKKLGHATSLFKMIKGKFKIDTLVHRVECISDNNALSPQIYNNNNEQLHPTLNMDNLRETSIEVFYKLLLKFDQYKYITIDRNINIIDHDTIKSDNWGTFVDRLQIAPSSPEASLGSTIKNDGGH